MYTSNISPSREEPPFTRQNSKDGMRVLIKLPKGTDHIRNDSIIPGVQQLRSV